MALWISIGLGALVFSLLVGMAVGAVLGHVARQVSDLLEHESWASAPPTARAR
jgi:F0F1-type ATP synthase membrane subunit c/vacuolar-type H+-ATPase subunit K